MSEIMTDEQLAELVRLHGAAKLGPMSSVHIISPGYQFMANLCTLLDGHEASYPVAMTYKEWADWFAALHNTFPALLHRLREAEREREEARSEAGGLRDALARLLADQLIQADKDGEEIILTVKQGRNASLVEASFHALESEDDKGWLAARDASQRKIGAVKALREAAGTLGVQKPVGGPREAGWEVCIEIVSDMAERLEKESGDV